MIKKNITPPTKATRNNSAIEILRVFFLVCLLFTHVIDVYWEACHEFLDIDLLNMLSMLSVNGFALITGIYIYKRSSLFFRNISRLIIIIMFSMIISFPILSYTGDDITEHLIAILTGSLSSWYLYGILFVYLFAPLMAKLIKNIKSFYIIITVSFIFLGTLIAQSTDVIQLITIFNTQGPYSVLFLLSMSLVGYVISRKENDIRMWIFSFFILTWLSVTVSFVLLDVRSSVRWFLLSDHSSLLTIIGAIGVVGLIHEMRWTSKIVNRIVSNLYFIYEYHWIFFILYRYIFREHLQPTSLDRHLYIYITLLTTLVTLIPLSYGITIIQRKFNKISLPIMEKWLTSVQKRIWIERKN